MTFQSLNFELIRDLRDDRIIVTGAGGVLGTALAHSLQKIPHRASLFLRRSDCDLLDRAATERLWGDFKPSLVFHLAGRVAGIQGNISFAGDAFYENMMVGLNVIHASRSPEVRKIVVASTAAIYSDSIQIPMREVDVWRGAPHGSEAPYGHAKRALLAQLEADRVQYGKEFCYLICTNLYGPNDRFDEKYGHVVPSLVARFHRAVMEEQANIAIWGDGTPTRDFLYSDDAAEAFIAAARFGSGVFNLASGTIVSIKELSELLKRVSKFRGELVWDGSKPNGQLVRAYDISGIRTLGWNARVVLSEGLTRTYQWYANNQGVIRR
jgi:GDP-L-fucose synthase